jgi:hypothetical protein
VINKVNKEREKDLEKGKNGVSMDTKEEKPQSMKMLTTTEKSIALEIKIYVYCLLLSSTVFYCLLLSSTVFYSLVQPSRAFNCPGRGHKFCVRGSTFV